MEGGTQLGGSPPAADKPYHSKRPHRKSRAGCRNCKARKVKCSEERPVCRACSLRREDCIYAASPPASARSPSAESSSLVRSAAHSPAASSTQLAVLDGADFNILSEPLPTAPSTDKIDMKLLWFYTTKGFDSFAIEAGRAPLIDEILTVKIPQHAFSSPFLMNCLLGLAALQLQHHGQGVDPSRAIAYRAKAFEGYRRAIEEAKPETFPALLASSLLLCALASQMFREADTKPLYIIDWMIVWRGIGLIVTIITPQALYDSGMAMLFARPPIDLNISAMHIPNNLLFMVSTIKEGDDDFADVDVYYDTLKYLGSLYYELQGGFSPILDLRVITWFTFLPKGFVELARQRRPRSLVIIAYYLAFVKLSDHVWWLSGIAEKEIRSISRHLGEEYYPLLRMPRKAIYIEDRAELAKMILDNHSWEPESRYGDNRDVRTQSLSLVDNSGHAITFYDGKHLVRQDNGEPGSWGVIKRDEAAVAADAVTLMAMNENFEYLAIQPTSSEEFYEEP